MRKSILLFLFLTAIMLAGCLPQTQSNASSTATTIARPAPATAVTLPAQAAVLPDSGCTVVTKKPTPGPTAEPVYPPITSADWIKGPDSAKMTLIEYSDFQ